MLFFKILDIIYQFIILYIISYVYNISPMTTIKWVIKSLWEKVQDIWNDAKKIPKDVKDFWEKKIIRPTQTLEDYGIDRNKLKQEELFDTLNRFQKNRWYNIDNKRNVKDESLWEKKHRNKEDQKDQLTKKIAWRLINALNRQNFPIDLYKIDDIYSKYINREELNLMENEIFDCLTSQDILSMQLFNYNSHFWYTQLKDGNDINSLTPYIPKKPKLQTNNEKSDKKSETNSEEYKNNQETVYESKKGKNTHEKKQEKRMWKIGWTEDVIKTFIDLWPLDKPTKILFINLLNNILESWWWAWVQHWIERVKRPNLLEMSKEEEDEIKNIIYDTVYNGGKYIMILNHETFANIPLTLIKFMKVAIKSFDIETINKYFTTVIWPLIAINKKQKRTLNMLSNISVTHPASNKIPGASRITQIIQDNANTQFFEDLANPNNKNGQIYFIAPSWTRDIINFANDWSSQIIIPNESWWSYLTTFRAIRLLQSKNPNLNIYTISTNTSDVKKPQWKVTTNNNKRPRNATASTHINKVKTKYEDFHMEDILHWLEKIMQDEKYEKLFSWKSLDDIKTVIENSSLKEKLLEYLTTENLSNENLVLSIWEHITYPIPSHTFTSKNPIKNRRNKWKKYYQYKDWQIVEKKCVVYAPPIIFEYLKKFTKESNYANTWTLPNIFLNENWEINTDEKSQIKLDREDFQLLLKLAKTKEYKNNRKIPGRFFNKEWLINIELLKSELENQK